MATTAAARIRLEYLDDLAGRTRRGHGMRPASRATKRGGGGRFGPDAAGQAAALSDCSTGWTARAAIWSRFQRLMAPIITVRLTTSASLNWLLTSS